VKELNAYTDIRRKKKRITEFCKFKGAAWNKKKE